MFTELLIPKYEFPNERNAYSLFKQYEEDTSFVFLWAEQEVLTTLGVLRLPFIDMFSPLNPFKIYAFEREDDLFDLYINRHILKSL